MSSKAVTLVSAQIICCGIVGIGPYFQQWRPPVFLREVFAILFCVGLLLFLVGVVNLGKSLTPNPIPKTSNLLVTNGIYSVSRHPIYLALLLAASSWSGYWFSPISLAGSVVLFLVLNHKAAFEEQLLLQRYGATYETYMLRVGRFLPRRLGH